MAPTITGDKNPEKQPIPFTMAISNPEKFVLNSMLFTLIDAQAIPLKNIITTKKNDAQMWLQPENEAAIKNGIGLTLPENKIKVILNLKSTERQNQSVIIT